VPVAVVVVVGEADDRAVVAGDEDILVRGHV
jgi:hypothetical protein